MLPFLLRNTLFGSYKHESIEIIESFVQTSVTLAYVNAMVLKWVYFRNTDIIFCWFINNRKYEDRLKHM